MSIRSVESSRITSSDPGYANCEETHAKLLIYPYSLNVSEVSDILKIKFTSAPSYEQALICGAEILKQKKYPGF